MQQRGPVFDGRFKGQLPKEQIEPVAVSELSLCGGIGEGDSALAVGEDQRRGETVENAIQLGEVG